MENSGACMPNVCLVPWRPEEGVRYPETKVTSGCNPLCAPQGIEPGFSATAASALISPGHDLEI